MSLATFLRSLKPEDAALHIHHLTMRERTIHLFTSDEDKPHAERVATVLRVQMGRSVKVSSPSDRTPKPEQRPEWIIMDDLEDGHAWKPPPHSGLSLNEFRREYMMEPKRIEEPVARLRETLEAMSPKTRKRVQRLIDETTLDVYYPNRKRGYPRTTKPEDE